MILLQLQQEISSTEWVDTCIYILDVSMTIGSQVYPLIIGINIIRTIGNAI